MGCPFGSGANALGFPEFGWEPAWTHGPWIAALILAATAVALQVASPSHWPLAIVATLFAASFFAGGLVTRAVGRHDNAFLPMVDLLSGEKSVVLDAGCGAGRTTLALGRAQKKARIVAVDRFDSGYIEGGGDFQGMGSIDPMMDKQRKKLLPCAADHRLDEPAKLSLGMVASPQFPPLFHLARLIVLSRWCKSSDD